MKKILFLVLGLLIGVFLVKGQATNNTTLLIYLTDIDGNRYTSTDFPTTEIAKFSATVTYGGTTITIPAGGAYGASKFLAVGTIGVVLKLDLQAFNVVGVIPLGAEIGITIITNKGIVKAFKMANGVKENLVTIETKNFKGICSLSI